MTKKAGGKVYLIVSRNGAVDIKDGYLPRAEAKRAAKRQQGEDAGEVEVSTSSRPEVTQGQNDYIEAHRQAAIRAALVKNPSAAFLGRFRLGAK